MLNEQPGARFLSHFRQFAYAAQVGEIGGSDAEGVEFRGDFVVSVE